MSQTNYKIITCPHCFGEVPYGAKVCRGCQAEIEYGRMVVLYLFNFQCMGRMAFFRNIGLGYRHRNIFCMLHYFREIFIQEPHRL